MKLNHSFILSVVSVVGVCFATAASAAPPPGKGNDKFNGNEKNWAITAFDETQINCPDGTTSDADVSGTSIQIGSTVPQCYRYSLAIPVEAPEGLKVLEELTSTFNLAPDAEDAADSAGVVDGLCDDGLCDGVATSDPAVCSVYTSRPDSAVKDNKGNIPAHQPEFVVISVDDDAACTVTLFAITDGAQKGADYDELSGELLGYDEYLPGSCTPLRAHTRNDADGDGEADIPADKLAGIITALTDEEPPRLLPFVESVALNTGSRVFMPDTEMLVDSENRNGLGGYAQFRALQLKPVGCDTDGDGEPDVSDSAPLDPMVWNGME